MVFSLGIGGSQPPGGGGGSSGTIAVTDGTTTVNNVTTLDFTTGATVNAGGSGIADIAINAGGVGTITNGAGISVTNPTGPNVTITSTITQGIAITDGTVTVNPTTAIVLAGAGVSTVNGGGGIADITIPGGMTALTGDVTASGTGSQATTLATVNTNVGSFGDGTHVGAFTVNAKGLITAASSVTITGAPPIGAAGGDLGGSYPNPTVLSVADVTTGTLGVAHGGTGLTVGTSGGILAFTATGTLTSTAILASSRIVVGGGVGSAPHTVTTGGSTTQVLHGAVGDPTWSQVSLTADVTGALPFANIATLSASSLAGNSTGGGLAIASVPIGAGLTFASGSLAVGGSGGTVDLSGQTEIKVPTPVNAADAATKAYVDNVAAGLNPAVAVQAATTAAGDTSGFTYNNGASGIGATLTGAVNTAFTVDGFTFSALGQRVLVKNDTQSPSGAFNGVYFVTQIQTAILPVILTRALDYDQPSDINNTGSIPVVNGTANGTTSWLLTSAVATVGTDPLTYVLFTRNPSNVVTSVIAQGGPFLANGTITSTGTISNSTASLTAHGIIIAEGTGAAVATAAMTNGQLLIGTTGSDPVPRTVSGDATLNSGGTLTVSTIGGVAPATVAGLGLALNSGTITGHTQVTVAATAGVNALTLAASTTNFLINGPAGGGACTITLPAASGIDQRIVMNISQGATAATWIFGAGFNFGTSVPSPTITAVAGKRDTMVLINNVGTVFDFEAINQGFSP